MLPYQTVWFIRISLFYFLLGSFFGAMLMWNKVFQLNPKIWRLLSLHFTILIWGFVVQYIMGTAYWMFPRRLLKSSHGSSRMAWIVFIIYNVGLCLFLVSKFLILSGKFIIIGKVLISFGILIFLKLLFVRTISQAYKM